MGTEGHLQCTIAFQSLLQRGSMLSKPYRILLTGVTGFLGASLAARLVEEGHQVIAFKRSWSRTSRIDSILSRLTCYDLDRTPLYLAFKRNPIDIVIHC